MLSLSPFLCSLSMLVLLLAGAEYFMRDHRHVQPFMEHFDRNFDTDARVTDALQELIVCSKVFVSCTSGSCNVPSKHVHVCSAH